MINYEKIKKTKSNAHKASKKERGILVTYKELRSLRKKINCVKAKIAVINDELNKTTQTISGLPHGGGSSDKTGDGVVKLIDAEIKLAELETEYQQSVGRLSKDIFEESCLIMFLIKRYSWTTIALKVGGNNTADSIRKACSRHCW